MFYFFSDPYGRDDDPGWLTAEKRARLAMKKERDLRFYYEERAGDYINVGFRLCEETGWIELNRCLVQHEFQVLVLGMPGEDAFFSGRPIMEFADALICPVVLVSPEGHGRFYLNTRAALITHQLALPENSRVPVETISA